MSDFKVDEVVDITIKGARVVRTGRDDLGRAFVEFSHGEYNTLSNVDRDDPAVNIARVAPAEWPPQPGDLWQEVDGALWFTQGLGGSQMAMIPAHARGNVDCALPAYVLETFGPLALVRRDGDEGAVEAAEGDGPATYLEPGSDIPGHPGYVVGTCGHRVAGSEWRSGFRTCERCPYPRGGAS